MYLQDLTVVIATYNRERFLLRNLSFWAGYPVQVHVLDGSNQPLAKEQQQRIPSNVQYHYLPVKLVERLAYAVDLPRTKYTVLMGDDEFYLPSALETCIEQLEHDPELISVGGRCLAFYWDGNDVRGFPDIEEQNGYAVIAETAGARMSMHMNPYTPSTIYAVTRTSMWQVIMKIATTFEYPIYAFGEIITELCNAFLGKSIVLPEVLWLRGKETSPIRYTDISLDPTRHFHRWWNSVATSTDRAALMDYLTTNLASLSATPPEQVRQAIFAAFQQRSNSSFKSLEITRRHRNTLPRRLLSVAKIILPQSIYQSFRIRYWKRKSKVIPAGVSEMFEPEVNCCMKELEDVCTRIRDFHIQNHSPPALF